jgi:hypothetical protein
MHILFVDIYVVAASMFLFFIFHVYDVDIVMSQIKPRSALDVPSFSIFPPAKSPTGVMTMKSVGGTHQLG